MPNPSHAANYPDPLRGAALLVTTPDDAKLVVHLDRAIAEGGIGVVYAAWEDSPMGPRPLAIKVLQERHAADPGITKRFEREVEHALRLRHPNVVSAIGTGRLADGRPFLAMELLEGATLGATIRRGGPLSIAGGLRLADQILAGLAAIHDARLVHRDLSPDNVFIATGDRAALLDLGFAQEPGVDAGDGVTPDSPGSLVGTLRFMAPEQATRGRAITERSDLFAAAVLLYYAFTGKLPFRGQDDLDVLVSVVRAAPVPLRRERRDAPAALEQVLGRALAKHPDARFASAREMRAALGRIRVDGPRAAASPSPPEPFDDGAASGPKPRAPAEPFTAGAASGPTEPPSQPASRRRLRTVVPVRMRGDSAYPPAQRSRWGEPSHPPRPSGS